MSRSLLQCCLALACVVAACSVRSRDHDRTSVTPDAHQACTDCSVGGRQAAADGGEAGQGEGVAGATPEGEGGAGGEALAPVVSPDGVAISELSFWQTLRVPLELNGAPVALIAPIILNKAGILRVYVAPDPRFQVRSLSAVLTWEVGSFTRSFESSKLIRMASNDAELSTTFNFPIAASEVQENIRYSLVLKDGAAPEPLARFPKLGQVALSPVSVSPSNALDVVVVPIRVGGLEPDVSPKTLAKFRSRVLAMYPLADVSLTAHAAVTTTLSVGPDQGWDAMLDLLYALRAQDAPSANVFYYGLFTPRLSFDDYCVTDCTVGYSTVPDADEVESRGSIGLGIFSDGSNSSAPDTMAHELGHALGRHHAPCSTDDAGPFPYPGGLIGVWGFDSQSHRLLDPLLFGDVMGYCAPDWISDFTYRALFTRIQSVNQELSSAEALSYAPQVGVYRRVLLGPNGVLRWGSRFTRALVSAGPARALRLLDAQGRVLGELSVPFRPFADASGGFLLVRESALQRVSGVAAIQLGNAVLALPTP